MGRAIIERPLTEIADFLGDPTSATIYDKYITVCLMQLTRSDDCTVYTALRSHQNIYTAIEASSSTVRVRNTERHHR